MMLPCFIKDVPLLLQLMRELLEDPPEDDDELLPFFYSFQFSS